ncbi:hypothetical protein ACFX5D_01225 [Flavobacterium sp. LB3P45]|uniref:Uncharacterized protein n=1 Tax=Flavobacterium fructosi TaxID=3230416 RepID=A0ABW6HHU4_9FLAO
MKLKIRPSQSDWDDLNGLFPENKETVTENNIVVMFSLFVIGIGLIVVVVFIVGISL